MRATVRCLFTQHPASVGETYPEHFVHAACFGASMLFGALACFVHAAIPGVCTTTGSRSIARLYHRMVVNRTRPRARELNESSQREFLGEHI
jgi:hypothetical protein